MSTRTFTPTVATVVPQWSSAAQTSARPLLLAELIDDYIAAYTGRDPSIGWRLETWRKLLGERPVLELTQTTIREALKRLMVEPARAYQGRDADGQAIHRVRSQRRAGGTINRYHAALSSVFQWAIDNEHVPSGWPNPCRGIKRARENPGVVRFLEPEERRRLLDACRTAAWPKMYGLVLLALTSGGRRSELLGLRWRDVDFEQAIAHLRITKNGESRVLVLVPTVMEELKRYPRGKPDELVFRSTRVHYDPMGLKRCGASCCVNPR